MTNPKVWDWRTYILKYGPEEAPQRHLLLTLSCYMDSTGNSCFPKIETLVASTKMSKPTIVKYLKKSREEGWIHVTKHGYRGRKWKRHEYHADLPEKVVKEINRLSERKENDDLEGEKPRFRPHKARFEECDSSHSKVVKELNHQPTEVVNDVGEGGKPGFEGGKPPLPKVVKEVNPYYINSSVTSPSNSTENTSTARAFSFVDFLKAYKKDVPSSQPIAEQLWMDLNREDRNEAVNFIPKYLYLEPHPKYRKDPVNYLRERFWENDGPARIQQKNESSSHGLIYYNWNQVLNQVHEGKARTTDEFEPKQHPISGEKMWIRKPKPMRKVG